MFLSADDIVLTHGTMEALSLAIMATTQAGDSIALEIPTFHNLYPLLHNLGRKIVEVPTSPHTGMCLDTLERSNLKSSKCTSHINDSNRTQSPRFQYA